MSLLFFFSNQSVIQGVSATGGAGSVSGFHDAYGVAISGTGQAGSPNIEVDDASSLAGVAGSGQAGSPSDEIDVGVSGVVGAGQIGTANIEINAPGNAVVGAGQAGATGIEVDASGVAIGGAGQAGNVTPQSTFTLANVSATGQVASISDQSNGAFSGNAGTGTAGGLTPQLALTFADVAAAGQAGSVGDEDDGIFSGVSGSGAAGGLTPQLALTLADVSAAGQVGSPIAEVTVSDGGAIGTGQIGSLTVEDDVNLAGVSATGAAGSPTANVVNSVIVAGIAGTGQVGSPTIEIDLPLASVTASGAAGSPITNAGQSISVVGVGGTGLAAPSLAEAIVSANIAALGAAGTSAIEIDIADPVGAFTGVAGTGQLGSAVADVEASGVACVGSGQVGSFTTEATLASVAANGVAGLPTAQVVPTTLSGVGAQGYAGTQTISAGTGSVEVSLFSDDSGIPGTFIATIGTFLDSDISASPFTITLTPTTQIPLEPNTRYWVKVSGNDATSAQWVLLGNDSGIGVDSEFFYTATLGSVPNSLGPSYQFSVDEEFESGAAGVGMAGTLSTSIVSSRKKRSGRGAPYKAPDYTETPVDTEPLADKMARWRKTVADALELPEKPEEPVVAEDTVPTKPDFSFLSLLDDVSLPRDDAESITSIVQTSRYQMLAEAEDDLLLGISEDDDFQLGLLTL